MLQSGRPGPSNTRSNRPSATDQIAALPPIEATASRPPSGATARATTGRGPAAHSRNTPSACRIRTNPSAPPAASAPPGSAASAFCGRPSSASTRPPRPSHSRTVPSAPALARPAVPQARAPTGPAWPSCPGQHPRRAVPPPDPHRAVPAGRGERAVRCHGERRDRPGMAFQDAERGLGATVGPQGRPDGDPPLLPRAGQPAAGQRRQRRKRAGMPAQHPPRRPRCRVPEDHRLVEAGRGQPAALQHRQGPHRPAMPDKFLRPGGERGEEEEQQDQQGHAAGRLGQAGCGGNAGFGQRPRGKYGRRGRAWPRAPPEGRPARDGMATGPGPMNRPPTQPIIIGKISQNSKPEPGRRHRHAVMPPSTCSTWPVM